MGIESVSATCDKCGRKLVSPEWRIERDDYNPGEVVPDNMKRIEDCYGNEYLVCKKCAKKVKDEDVKCLWRGKYNICAFPGADIFGERCNLTRETVDLCVRRNECPFIMGEQLCSLRNEGDCDQRGNPFKCQKFRVWFNESYRAFIKKPCPTSLGRVMGEKKGIIYFLKTKIPKSELAIALKVAKEFWENGSDREYMDVSFWMKFDQFEEYLEYLVEGKPLEKDTVEVAKTEGILKGGPDV